MRLVTRNTTRCLFAVIIWLLPIGVASASDSVSVSVEPVTSQNSPNVLARPLPTDSITSSSGPIETVIGRSTSPADAIPIVPGEELTLNEAIGIALRYHPREKEAAADTDAAHERVGEARSDLGPQVFGVGEYLRSTDNGIGNTSYYDTNDIFPRMTGINHNLSTNDFSQSWDTSNNYAGGLALSQFLFDFGRRHGFVRQREFEAAVVAANQRLVELDLIFNVSRQYYDVLQGQQLIRVYEKAVEQRRYHLHEAEVKANAGLRPQIDVYVMRAEVERAQLDLTDARNAHADSKVALDNALGLSDSVPEYHLAEATTYLQINDSLNSLIQTAMRKRPDLKALQNQASAMGAKIDEFNSVIIRL